MSAIMRGERNTDPYEETLAAIRPDGSTVQDVVEKLRYRAKASVVGNRLLRLMARGLVTRERGAASHGGAYVYRRVEAKGAAVAP